MKIHRLVAVNRDGGHSFKNYKFVFLCGITDSGKIEEGEWFGYYQGEDEIYPFILKNGRSCLYGGEEHYSEKTNIGTKTIQLGTLFSVMNPPGSNDEWEAVYEVTSCHPYSG